MTRRKNLQRILQLPLILALTLVTQQGCTKEKKTSYSDVPKKITIGFIPGTERKELEANAQKLARVLERKLGIAVETYISDNYSGLIQAMKEKKVDFAFYTAMTFVFAEKQAGAKVLLKKVWSSPFYHSAVLVRKDSKYKAVKDLKGKHFAFVDEKSTSGYLYPQVMLKKNGIKADRFFGKVSYSGNHTQSVKWLSDKKVDAVAVYSNDKLGMTGAWVHSLPKQKASQLKTIWMSEPIPTDPFCVRNEFYQNYPRLTHDLMFSLIELNDGEKKVLTELLNVKRLDLATTQQYQPVRELVRELNLKLDQ